ncbi:cytochrome P450 [Ceratobasidium sp. AG-I]|nr:cytochrome P450 [Ceratobasidium sp. AG-I]
MPLTIGDYVVTTTTVLYLIALQRGRKRNKLPLPPGPPRWPVIGSLLSMPQNHEMREVFTSWGKIYGDVTYVRALDQNIIVLNSKEAAIELLERRSAMYSHRPRLVMANELVGWGDSLATGSYGENFKQLRKLLYEGMSPKAMETLVPLQEQEAIKFIQKLLHSPNDFLQQITRTANATIMKVTYGYTVQERDDYFLLLAQRMVDMFSIVTTPGSFLVDVFPWLKYIPWAPFKSKAKAYRKILMDSAEEPVQYTREQMIKGQSQPCLVSTWIERANEAGGKAEMEKAEGYIKWAGVAIYGGATDTTVSAISSFFLAVLLYPEVQKAAQVEIDRVIGTERLPTYSDRASLPYVEAVCKEVLRWHPVAPFAVPHRLDWEKDDEYRGMLIPKGSVIIPNIWTMARDPNVYHSPEIFNPKRFLPGKNTPEADPEDIAFGFGRRRCPGIHLAHSSVWLSIVLTLAVYDITPAIGPDGKPKIPSLSYSQATISHPDPFECTIKPRSSKAESLIKDSDL